MLVHSFSDTSTGLDDYRHFADALGIENPVEGKLQQHQEDDKLYVGWVRGEPRFKEAGMR